MRFGNIMGRTEIWLLELIYEIDALSLNGYISVCIILPDSKYAGCISFRPW